MKDDKPSIELTVVLEVMEELIPTLTRELEAIAKALDAKDTPAAERRALISKQYVQRSGELTAALCEKRNLDIRAFQQALIFYHDDAAFEQALARLSAEQQDAYVHKCADLVVQTRNNFAGGTILQPAIAGLACVTTPHSATELMVVLSSRARAPVPLCLLVCLSSVLLTTWLPY